MRKKTKLSALTRYDIYYLGQLIDNLSDFRDWYVDLVANLLLIEESLATAEDPSEINELYELRAKRVQEILTGIRKEPRLLKSLLGRLSRKMDEDYQGELLQDILPPTLLSMLHKAMNGDLSDDSSLD